MPRPKKMRCVSGGPITVSFVPENMPPTGEVILSVEGYEAVRLSDYEGLDQESGAQRMEVSRQTFGRILSEARGRIAESLVTGKALRIEGGEYVVRKGPGRRRRRHCGGRMRNGGNDHDPKV